LTCPARLSSPEPPRCLLMVLWGLIHYWLSQSNISFIFSDFKVFSSPYVVWWWRFLRRFAALVVLGCGCLGGRLIFVILLLLGVLLVFGLCVRRFLVFLLIVCDLCCLSGMRI